MDNQTLLRLKETIEQLERELARDEGSLRQMLRDLKDQGYNSVEEAVEKVEALKEEITQKENELQERISKIEETVEDWEDVI